MECVVKQPFRIFGSQRGERPERVVLPPFAMWHLDCPRELVVRHVLDNPHPTDLLLDTSVFSLARLPLVRELMRTCRPILLTPVRLELEDLKAKAALAELRKLVFPGGSLS